MHIIPTAVTAVITLVDGHTYRMTPGDQISHPLGRISEPFFFPKHASRGTHETKTKMVFSETILTTRFFSKLANYSASAPSTSVVEKIISESCPRECVIFYHTCDEVRSGEQHKHSRASHWPLRAEAGPRYVRIAVRNLCVCILTISGQIFYTPHT